MSSAAVPQEEIPVSGPVPQIVRDSVTGLALAAATANIIMQLSRLPVGHGVAESKVESGRLDKHPVKRGRTTLSYVAVAMLGTDAERALMRREVNRSHQQVRSGPGDPVAYNAFDRDLQLWVAACLYLGTEQIYELLHGELDPETIEVLYQHGARFGTTLQVPQDMWPADRAAFEAYWNASVALVRTDETTRSFLLDLTDLKFLPAPLAQLGGPVNRFVTTGFLPQEFRDELGLPWSARSQAHFDRYIRLTARLNRALPPLIRAFPFNAYLWDFRRRVRAGRPIT
ncbi:MAG: oxygenase MpaB family protein [Streptosporangiaceae bacterium]